MSTTISLREMKARITNPREHPKMTKTQVRAWEEKIREFSGRKILETDALNDVLWVDAVTSTLEIIDRFEKLWKCKRPAAEIEEREILGFLVMKTDHVYCILLSPRDFKVVRKYGVRVPENLDLLQIDPHYVEPEDDTAMQGTKICPTGMMNLLFDRVVNQGLYGRKCFSDINLMCLPLMVHSFMRSEWSNLYNYTIPGSLQEAVVEVDYVNRSEEILEKYNLADSVGKDKRTAKLMVRKYAAFIMCCAFKTSAQINDSYVSRRLAAINKALGGEPLHFLTEEIAAIGDLFRKCPYIQRFLVHCIASPDCDQTIPDLSMVRKMYQNSQLGSVIVMYDFLMSGEMYAIFTNLKFVTQAQSFLAEVNACKEHYRHLYPYHKLIAQEGDPTITVQPHFMVYYCAFQDYDRKHKRTENDSKDPNQGRLTSNISGAFEKLTCDRMMKRMIDVSMITRGIETGQISPEFRDLIKMITGMAVLDEVKEIPLIEL